MSSRDEFTDRFLGLAMAEVTALLRHDFPAYQAAEVEAREAGPQAVERMLGSLIAVLAERASKLEGKDALSVVHEAALELQISSLGGF